MTAQTFRYPRWLAWALIALSVLLMAALVILPNHVTLPGTLFLCILVIPAAIGWLALRFRIVVDEVAIDVFGLKHRCFLLVDVASIAIALSDKGGRIATVTFKDGRSWSFDDTLDGFRALLDLLSQRTSRPITRSVWEPDILGRAR